VSRSLDPDVLIQPGEYAACHLEHAGGRFLEQSLDGVIACGRQTLVRYSVVVQDHAGLEIDIIVITVFKINRIDRERVRDIQSIAS
jgi:hypothetical protein